MSKCKLVFGFGCFVGFFGFVVVFGFLGGCFCLFEGVGKLKLFLHFTIHSSPRNYLKNFNTCCGLAFFFSFENLQFYYLDR